MPRSVGVSREFCLRRSSALSTRPTRSSSLKSSRACGNSELFSGIRRCQCLQLLLPTLTPANLCGKLVNVCSFDLFDIPGPSCITADWGYLKLLMAYTLTPAFISFLLWIPTGILWCARKTKTQRFKNVADAFWFIFLFWLFLIYPLLSTKTIQGFHCRTIAGSNLLVVDLKEECPMEDFTSATFLWALVTTIIYPFGIPLLFYVVLVRNKVPEIARRKEDRALFSQLISIYKSSKSATVSGKLATHIGRVATKSGHETSITSAAKHIFDLLKDRGDEASYHNLLGYLHDVGVAQPEDLDEFNEFFNQFDHDKDAALDWAEFQVGRRRVPPWMAQLTDTTRARLIRRK